MSSSLAPIPTATRLRDDAARMAADRDQRRTAEELELLNADSVDFPQNVNRTAIDDLWDKTPIFDEDAEMPFFVDEAAVIKRVAIKQKTMTPRLAVGAVPAPQAAPSIGVQKAAMTRSQVWGGVVASWSLVSPQLLVVAFAFSAGWIDANSKTRFGTFGSLMTGNVIDMSMAIARLDWKHAFLSGFNIFAFQVGVVADLIIANLAAARRRVQQLGVSSPAPVQNVGLLRPEDFQSHMGRGYSTIVICGFLVWLELIALFEDHKYPSTDRRILGAFCAAAMGAQNAWTTRSSLKTSTVIVGTNLQKVAEILYLRVRRQLEGCCSSSVPELGRRFPSINNFLPERQDTGERKAPLLRSLPSIVREAVAKQTDVRKQESALLTRLALCCVAYAVGAVGGAEAARVCCIGSLLPAALLIGLALQPWR